MKTDRLLPVIVFLVIETICLPSFSSDMSDPCSSRIPKTLANSLAKLYPEYRLPQMNDHLPDDIAYDKKNGGDGCLSVAIGDFNGDKKRDIAVLLTNKEKTKVILVAALKLNNGWKIDQLPTWCESMTRCYVQKLQPGVL